MSLIRTRRERRAQAGTKHRPPSPVRLVLLLILVAGLIWYLSRVGG
jgi:hypothetical protein